MTDNEIIKALECCQEDVTRCGKCPLRYECISLPLDDVKARYALDLINRQKEEIERLKKHIQEGIDLAKQIPEMVALAQSEAIKEFAERMNKEAEKVCIDQEGDFVEADNEIYDTVADWHKETSYNLLKETAGAESGS